MVRRLTDSGTSGFPDVRRSSFFILSMDASTLTTYYSSPAEFPAYARCGSEWSASLETKLLTEAGVKPGTSLDDWLRNGFFEQHCERFHNRPFVWPLWDGRNDGLSCLVNYHNLDHMLE